jgi:hypothetical protein
VLAVCSFINNQENICLLIYAFKMWGISLLILISILIHSVFLSLTHTLSLVCIFLLLLLYVNCAPVNSYNVGLFPLDFLWKH